MHPRVDRELCGYKKKHKIIEEGAGFMSVVHKYLCVLLMQEDLEGELDGAVY